VSALLARAWLGLALPCVLLLPVAAAAAAPPDFAGIGEAAADAVQSREIPGVVVLVGRGDDIVFQHAYGWRRLLPQQEPMTLDTIFDIASLTKPFGTTLAVMSLVERGEVKLDAPLGHYLREFRGPRHEGVTIRRLLEHSAGLPAIPPEGSLRGGFPAAARALAAAPLDYPPGSAFEYSDTGFILLGEMVRRVSGLPLDRYLDKTVFKPLGLRSTWFHTPASVRARIAPTEFNNGVLLTGEVHDPRARALGGVAGHAGMFSTVADLARICRMLVDQGSVDGHRVLKASTVAAMWTRQSGGTRALGWDVASPYATRMQTFFPMGSVGHTGYTGTAVWIDPPTRTYMLILTNRVHPSGGGAAKILELRQRISAVIGAALFAPPLAAAAADGELRSPAADDPTPPARVVSRTPVRTGLDVLASQHFDVLAGYSVGLVTNQTGVDTAGRRGIDLIAGAAPRVRLQAIFSPEHGLSGEATTEVPNGLDPATGLPVWSLYGATRRPTAEMLRGVNLLVYDMQDVGTRYYTYLTTLVYVMEEAARRGIPLMVLDRPDPITGSVVEGPLIDPDLESFTAPHAIPVRPGMTIGEFARMVAAERNIPVALTVVKMDGWTRGRWYDETGLPWVNPSPNIRSVTGALLYSGLGLLEGANLSVGRGTDVPFEVIGAPWIEPMGLAAALNALHLPGVRFDPLIFTPTDDAYARQPCGGVRIVVTDRGSVRSVTVALALARALRERHREQFRAEAIQTLLVNRATMWAFLRDDPLDRVMAWADADRSSFLNRRASYLIYK